MGLVWEKVGLPLWQLWGLDRQRIGPTAVTVGINTPDRACDRIPPLAYRLPPHPLHQNQAG